MVTPPSWKLWRVSNTKNQWFYMVVSEVMGVPELSSIFDWHFLQKNNLFWGTPIPGNHHMVHV